jgi:LysR family transcriptional regulator, glycine cleavage system transcriptional activator
MSRVLPSLNALKAFEAAARHESLTLAAAELNVAHAAISRHIRTLESSLRVALFERTGRGVILTEEGRMLARSLTEAFDLIANATSRYARSPRRRQRLTISSDVALATHWLVSRLGRFTSEHPGIELIIDPSLRLVDFAKDDVDFGIRCGGGAWRNVEAEKLADADLTVVCSPRLLQSSPVRSVTDLPGHALMREQDRALWPAWLEAAGASAISPSGPTLLVDLTMTAAEAGQGFALADRIVAADALLAGRLVSPFDIKIQPYGYYLVRRQGGAMSKAANDFRAWLKVEISRTIAATSRFYSGNNRAPDTSQRKATIASPPITRPSSKR